MTNDKAMVAIYDDHDLAEEAVKKLQNTGFDVSKLSIVGKDYHTDEKVLGYYNMGDRMVNWGVRGAFWGSIWGILVGSAFFVIPGIGPLVIAGSFVSTLVGALEGAAIAGGLSALGGALASLGIPKDSILTYETDIRAGKFMLLAYGTKEEAENAREILGMSNYMIF